MSRVVADAALVFSSLSSYDSFPCRFFQNKLIVRPEAKRCESRMERNTNSLSESLRIGDAILENYTLSSSCSSGPKTCSIEDADIVWAKGTDALKNHLDQQIFTAWIKPLKIVGVAALDSENTSVILSAPNKFCRDHVQRHYGQLISSTLSEVIGSKDTLITFKVDVPSVIRATPSTSKEGDAKKAFAKKRGELDLSIRANPKGNSQIDATNLNSKYNFSNFVVGTCNQFAHAASLKVADCLGSAYNPLFIYGGVGLGKTHLANAIGNASRRRNKKVLLISSEAFVSELISSLRSNNVDRFKNKLRTVDLLIVDDIQFLIGKERTQEEFFHTFNELHNRQKQIVITSDKVPQELVGLEERLRTRFASGLSVDLQAPDFETRVAILTKKSEANGVSLPNQVASMLAERIDTNVRELEGALNQLQALCSLHNTTVSVELTEEVLKSIAPRKRVEVTIELIQKVVAERFNVSLNDLVGKRRTYNIAFARQAAMYICRQLTSRSYPEIGAYFGGRDHSTVIHAKRVISEKLQTDSSFQSQIDQLQRRILSY